MNELTEKLNALLEVNQRMLDACAQQNWHQVADLDASRRGQVESLETLQSTKADEEQSLKIVKIIELDERIKGLVEQAHRDSSAETAEQRRQQSDLQHYKDGA